MLGTSPARELEVPVGGSTQGPAPGASPSTKTGWGAVQVEGCRQGWPCLVMGSPRLQGQQPAHGQAMQLTWVN